VLPIITIDGATTSMKSSSMTRPFRPQRYSAAWGGWRQVVGELANEVRTGAILSTAVLGVAFATDT